MTQGHQLPPVRGDSHQALAMFLGRWRAAGVSYGTLKPPSGASGSVAEPWVSTHTGKWHTGEFFLIQEEHATVAGRPFDTLSVMGVDAATGRLFARTFENHGFHRDYGVVVDGFSWTITGESERASIVFSDNGRTQTISWEWKPADRWLPLCDRIAHRDD